MENYGHNP